MIRRMKAFSKQKLLLLLLSKSEPNLGKNFRSSMTSVADDRCLKFSITAECDRSYARTGIMNLRHYDVETPIFMPVGTQVN